jgi:beta-glucanase (GH16 family)
MEEIRVKLKAKMITACLVIAAFVLPAGASAYNAINETFPGANPRNLANFTYGTGRTSSHDALTRIDNGILRMAIDQNDTAGAWQGRNYGARQLSHFGTYSARIKIPSAETQPNIGAVVGFYTYYNDEWSSILPPDINGNGIYDNSEIDFEWLIADPQIIYLTAWTDYQDYPDGSTAFRKVGRILNLATGTIISTEYGETWGHGVRLTGLENQPQTIPAIPGYDASKNFYTYGFDWQPNRIRWWIINPDNPNEQITLWDYRGPVERITQKPAFLSFNIWHTNNWPVVGKPNSVQRPNGQFWAEFDWIKYEPVTYGDVNGDGQINAADVTLLRGYIAAQDKTAWLNANTNFRPNNADINADGFISAADVTLLRRYIAAADKAAVPLGAR